RRVPAARALRPRRGRWEAIEVAERELPVRDRRCDVRGRDAVRLELVDELPAQRGPAPDGRRRAGVGHEDAELDELAHAFRRRRGAPRNLLLGQAQRIGTVTSGEARARAPPPPPGGGAPL